MAGEPVTLTIVTRNRAIHVVRCGLDRDLEPDAVLTRVAATGKTGGCGVMCRCLRIFLVL